MPADIPGPWSRPAPPKPPLPGVPTPAPAPADDAAKDWGPLKPIRTVPKPNEKKVAYILAQTEHVVNPDEEHARKKWIIFGSIAAFLIIVGGTLAFVFFGRNTQEPRLDSNSVIIVNTGQKNANASTDDVFPNADLDRNSNVNASATNVAAVDADGDGLSDADEVRYKTNAKNIDSDGDGFTDGQEVQGGYNPLGPGKL